MTPADYYTALANACDDICREEAKLRKLASWAPGPVDREEALAAADVLSSIKRHLRIIVAGAQETPEAVRNGHKTVTTIGPLTVDRVRMKVTLEGEEVPMPLREFQLLSMLALEPERVYTKAQLLRTLWGYPTGARTRTLDSHACRLRLRLGGGWVGNIRGVGYRLQTTTTPEEAIQHG